jgi:hypothetical protein
MLMQLREIPDLILQPVTVVSLITEMVPQALQLLGTGVNVMILEIFPPKNR